MSITQTKTAEEKYCSECGSIINAKAEICPKCGVRQMASSPASIVGKVSPSGRNRLAAALFALFLGGFGAPKFYLGQIGTGVIYLLFCWTFIPAIIGFIEGILLLSTTDDLFVAKYG